MRIKSLLLVVFAVLGGAIPSSVLGQESNQSPAPAQPQIPQQLRPAVEALRKKDPETALQIARRYVSDNPDDAMGHAVRGEAALRRRQWREAEESLKRALTIQPNLLGSALLLADLYHDTGRFGGAEQILEKILSVQPNLEPALVLQGLVKIELGKAEEASELFTRAAARDPNARWPRLGKAVVQRVRGDLSGARAALEALVKDQPDWSLAHMQLGETLLLQREQAAALKAFDQAERTSADADQARLRVARLLVVRGFADLGVRRARTLLSKPAVAPAARALIVQVAVTDKRFDDAQKLLREAVAAAPNDPVAAMQLGQFYLARGQAKLALVEFDRALTLRPDAVDAVRAKAEAHIALGQPDQAVAAAERLVKLQDGSADAYQFLGGIQQRLGRGAAALDAYNKALAKTPNHLATMRALAALHDAENRPTDAAKVLQDAANAHPQSAMPLVDLAQMLERRGQANAAVPVYREAARRAPQDPGVLNNLAYALSKDAATLSEAGQLAERARRLAPRNAAIADTFGWILFRQGETERALPLLQEAAQGMPGAPEVQYHLGQVYARTGKRAEARAALERALQTPRFADADEARKLLETLR
jgi:tetratricopeptide (TPR) repeat protein